MAKQILTLLCLVLGLIHFTHADYGTAGDVELPEKVLGDSPIIITKSHGKIVKIPKWDPNVKLSDQRYAFDNKVMEDVSERIRYLTSQILVKKVGALTITKDLMGLGGFMLSIFMKNSKLKKVDTSPRLRSGLGVTNGEMLERMLEEDKSLLSLLTPEEALERMEVATDAMVKVTAASNTGSVLVWEKLTLNDEPLETYLKPVIQMLIDRSKQIRKVLKVAASHLRATKDEA